MGRTPWARRTHTATWGLCAAIITFDFSSLICGPGKALAVSVWPVWLKQWQIWWHLSPLYAFVSGRSGSHSSYTLGHEDAKSSLSCVHTDVACANSYVIQNRKSSARFWRSSQGKQDNKLAGRSWCVCVMGRTWTAASDGTMENVWSYACHTSCNVGQRLQQETWTSLEHILHVLLVSVTIRGFCCGSSFPGETNS